MDTLTQDELDALQASTLHRKTPYIIQNVSRGYFSIARYYGSASIKGSSYIYNPTSNELVRDDVLKWLVKHRKTREKNDKGQIHAEADC